MRVDREIDHAHASIRRAVLKDIYDAIHQLSIPMAPNFPQGFDGTYYHLRIANGAGHVSIYCWCSVSDELRPVLECIQQIQSTVDNFFAE